MKVFVTGATGHVGFHVALAFRRAGHHVLGLTRSEKGGARLDRHEIRPVIGSLQDPGSWKGAEDAAALVHAAFDFKGDSWAVDRSAIEALVALAHRGAAPKTVVYTSGVWVYGQTGDGVADETTPLAPLPMSLSRVETEKRVLSAAGVKGIVMRPGSVYGYGGSLTGMWFEGAAKGALEAVGDGHNRWATVHADDCADAYVRAASSGLSGEIFNVTDRSRAPVRRLVTAAARAAAFKGEIRWISVEDARKKMGELADALALDQHVESRKAVVRLGWQPAHGGFEDEVETYYAAWKAAQG
ncbi:MAG TPA: NAD-dependent epimerase/dehydratase family protein [Thermoanaerobaculia bacterium]|jgi:nucleoside-diphosphate-sugar epimerase|nr:NAD-dependent epimerase/dehydratase family protein [Thermoanaerobaculia bacterium]